MNESHMIFRLKIDLSTIVNEMLDRLPKSIWTSTTTRFLDPCMGGGQFVAEIERRLREAGHRDENIAERVFGIEKNELYVMYAVNKFKLVGQYVVDNSPGVPNTYTSMKFDCIVGNPPYQKKVGPKKSAPIWHQFVEKSILSLNSDGYLCMVHPSGWRNVDGLFSNTKRLLTTLDMMYLEIHDVRDGVKVFNAETRYDFYVLRNRKSAGKTTVKFQDGETRVVDISSVPFLPNGEYDRMMSLISSDVSNQCNVIHSWTDYESRSDWMSKKRTSKYKHPIVSLVRKNGDIECQYSSKKSSQFGISKVIWSNTRLVSLGAFIDDQGKYGMTEYTYGLADAPKNLIKIKKLMESEQFKSFMENAIVDIFPGLNRKVLALFRKDFWKEFI